LGPRVARGPGAPTGRGRAAVLVRGDELSRGSFARRKTSDDDGRNHHQDSEITRSHAPRIIQPRRHGQRNGKHRASRSAGSSSRSSLSSGASDRLPHQFCEHKMTVEPPAAIVYLEIAPNAVAPPSKGGDASIRAREP